MKIKELDCVKLKNGKEVVILESSIPGYYLVEDSNVEEVGTFSYTIKESDIERVTYISWGYIKSGLDKINLYNGINTIVRIPTGEEIEIQYHTPRSLEVKEKQHKLYEIQRKTKNKKSKEYFDLQMKMFDLSDKLDFPYEIERIKNE